MPHDLSEGIADRRVVEAFQDQGLFAADRHAQRLLLLPLWHCLLLLSRFFLAQKLIPLDFLHLPLVLFDCKQFFV
jgi:hypothetical protein